MVIPFAPRRARRAHVQLFLLVSLALGACGDNGTGPTERERFADIWDLISVDGQPLPFELTPGPPVRVELLEIELDLRDPVGPGVEARTLRGTPANGGPPQVTSGTTAINFEVSGNQVTIINTGSGLPDDVGTLNNNRLTISRSVLGTYRTHVYQRR